MSLVVLPSFSALRKSLRSIVLALLQSLVEFINKLIWFWTSLFGETFYYCFNIVTVTDLQTLRLSWFNFANSHVFRNLSFLQNFLNTFSGFLNTFSMYSLVLLWISLVSFVNSFFLICNFAKVHFLFLLLVWLEICQSIYLFKELSLCHYALSF